MNKWVCWLVGKAKTRRHEMLPIAVLWNQEVVGWEEMGRWAGVNHEPPLGERMCQGIGLNGQGDRCGDASSGLQDWPCWAIARVVR